MSNSFYVKFPGLNKEIVFDRITHNQFIFDWILEQLPLKVFFYAPVVSGWSICTTLSTKTPITWKPGTEVIENLVEIPVGRVNIFMPNGHCVNWGCKFGKNTKPMSYPTIANVRQECINSLISVGIDIWYALAWYKNIIRAEFTLN